MSVFAVLSDMAERLIFNPETGELIYTSRHGVLSQDVDSKEAPAPVEVGIEEQGDGGTLALKVKISRMEKRLLKALQSSDPVVRTSGLKLLKECDLDYRRLAVHAIAALADSSETVRSEALSALNFMPPRKKDLSCFYPLLDPKRPEVIQATLSALGRLEDEARDASKYVIPLIKSCPVCLPEITNCLRRIGVAQDAIHVASLLIRDSDATVRLSAISVFSECDSKALPLLHLIVPRLNDPVEEIRNAAADAFSKLGYHYSAIKEIKRQLDHSSVERCLIMIKLLSQCDSSARDLSPVLVDLLAHTDEHITSAAEYAIDCIGVTPDCIKALLKLSRHPKWTYRKKALEVIGKHPEVLDEALAIVSTAVADPEPEVRKIARLLFVRLELSEKAEPFVKALLTDKDLSCRKRVLEMFGALGHKAYPLSHLVMARIEETSFEIARLAAETLLQTGVNDRAWGIAERILRNSKQDRKLLLLNLFEQMEHDARPGIVLICGRLGDSDRITRDAAATAFASVGFNTECLPVVRELIRHQNREFRLSVIDALGKCGLSAQAAAEFLSSRIQDTDAEVGRAAKAALKAIGL
ncbi:MAG: HEAT repeat domain-containing protein [Opitutales bacterium]|nr:HEAT repeat domain-containing protein [Opitutales bacterium]